MHSASSPRTSLLLTLALPLALAACGGDKDPLDSITNNTGDPSGDPSGDPGGDPTGTTGTASAGATEGGGTGSASGNTLTDPGTVSATSGLSEATTAAASSGPTSETTAGPTTDTASGTTDGTTAGSSTTEGGSSTGGGDGYGNCGWNAAQMYYACDGTPGQADPQGDNPIACPAELPAEGQPCTDALTGIGCCRPNGDNYYCSNDNTVVIDPCGG